METQTPLVTPYNATILTRQTKAENLLRDYAKKLVRMVQPELTRMMGKKIRMADGSGSKLLKEIKFDEKLTVKSDDQSVTYHRPHFVFNRSCVYLQVEINLWGLCEQGTFDRQPRDWNISRDIQLRVGETNVWNLERVIPLEQLIDNNQHLAPLDIAAILEEAERYARLKTAARKSLRSQPYFIQDIVEKFAE